MITPPSTTRTEHTSDARVPIRATHSLRGVLCSVLASTLFGTMFLLSGVVDAAPDAVFAWRVVITIACYAVMLAFPAGRRSCVQLWLVLRSAWWMPAVVVVTAAIVGVQMWLFAWTPVHGHALDASMGYLLLPITLVLVGRILFHERVSRLQWVAVAIAAVAVGVNVATTGAVSWVTFAICIGYALYFSLRKHFRLDGAATFGLEVALLLPVAVTLLISTEVVTGLLTQLGVLTVGLAGAAAMSAYLAASKSLSMPVFGLLSYGEPVLMFAVAIVLGERLHTGGAIVYIVLAVALGVLAVDGFISTPARDGRAAKSPRH